MKLALISVGLFMLSYVVMNGGLGPRPFLLVIPLVIAGGPAVVYAMLGRGRKRTKTGRAQLEEAFLHDEPPERIVPRTPPHQVSPNASSVRAPGASSGRKAKKLF